MRKPTSLEAAVAAAEQAWLAESRAGSLAAGTAQGYAKNLKAFYGYAQAHGVHLLDGVDQRLCRSWIEAPLGAALRGSRSRARHMASDSTRRGRQTALRRAAKLWLELGLIDANPVPTDVIQVHGSVGSSPLTPPEVAQLRLAGRSGTRDSLLPAMVEAALAGASQQSIALLIVTSFDATQGVLRIPGSRQTYERDLQLGPTAVAAMHARVADLARSASRSHMTFDPTSAPLLVGRGPEPSRSANQPQVVASNLKRALAAAGVNRPGVTAGSLQAFAANACYARTNRVEDVAELLGLHSLDRAMAKIDHQWQSAWAEQVRQPGRSLTAWGDSRPSAARERRRFVGRTRDLRRLEASVSSARPSESETSALKPRSRCCWLLRRIRICTHSRHGSNRTVRA